MPSEQPAHDLASQANDREVDLEQERECEPPSVESLAAERYEVHCYLARLLISCAPRGEPDDDLMTLCTQIDNLLAGNSHNATVTKCAEIADQVCTGGCACGDEIRTELRDER